jgi:hypothetical protein
MRPEHAKKPATPAKTAKPTAPVTTGAGKPEGNGDPNEGEGNRTAARRYDTATEKYIATGRSGAAATAAAEALDGPEGDELRAAEKVGKAGHPKRTSS